MLWNLHIRDTVIGVRKAFASLTPIIERARHSPICSRRVISVNGCNNFFYPITRFYDLVPSFKNLVSIFRISGFNNLVHTRYNTRKLRASFLPKTNILGSIPQESEIIFKSPGSRHPQDFSGGCDIASKCNLPGAFHIPGHAYRRDKRNRPPRGRIYPR